MSADNWTICPRCKKNAEAKAEKAQADLAKLYGKISAADFLARSNALKDAAKEQLEETFREDYQVGMKEDGTFKTDYRGGCTECKFSFVFKEERDSKP